MVVSLAIFTVVALVAVGALLKVMDANKKSQSLKTSLNNLNFALDSISREMRVGSTYYCVSGGPGAIPYTLVSSMNCDISSGPWTVAFNSSKTAPPENPTCNLIRAYYFDGKGLYQLQQSACGGDLEAPFRIISHNVNIEPAYGGLAAVRVRTGTNIQPFVQFHIKGFSGNKEKIRTYFDLQTSVSQRLSI